MQTIKEALAQNLTFIDWFKQSSHPIERKNKLQLLWEQTQKKSQSLPQKSLALIVVDSNGFPLGGHRAKSFILHDSKADAQAFGLEHFGKFNFQILPWHWFKKSQIGRYIARRQRIMARRTQRKNKASSAQFPIPKEPSHKPFPQLCKSKEAGLKWLRQA